MNGLHKSTQYAASGLNFILSVHTFLYASSEFPASIVTGYRRLYLCDRFFEQKMAENKDKNTNRQENNGCYSSISLVSVIQILAST